jgi:hypothetical protein
MDAEPERAGILIVRAWVEEGEHDVRARIIYSLDASSDEQVTRSAAGIGSIEAIVREWLNLLVDSA